MMYLSQVYPEFYAMWKQNLSRQITKLLPSLKISGFLILWNAVFHSLTLSILLYWSLSSTRVPEMARMTTLNQFWAENQILFATLCGLTGAIFFRNEIGSLYRERIDGRRWFAIHALRGAILSLIVIVASILRGRYQFLGLSTQLNLNFLSSYAWILRSSLLLAFVFSNEFLARKILKGPVWIRIITQLSVYWIWFYPTQGEFFSLALLSLLFVNFWAASGFLASVFIVSHAVFGLPFFENEFSGLFQVKAGRPDETFIQNPYFQVTLLVLLFLFRYAKLLFRRKEPIRT